MKWKIGNLQTRLYLITAIILLVGLSSATVIYLRAENASGGDSVYEIEHSKKYRHDLELIGGKMNVFADEFCRWFEKLWHGKSLACIVACITIFISIGFSFVAYHLPFDLNLHDQGEDNRGSTGNDGTAKDMVHSTASTDKLNTS
jgi:hypothetical protein